jgi:peptide/nickel transport system substrate-binding protein
VTSSSTGQLLLLDPRRNRVTQAVPIGNGPAGVAVGAGSVWVANTPESAVTRYDPGTGDVRKIAVGKGPVGVAYKSGAVWVADSLDGTITRIDPDTNGVRVVRVGSEPTALSAGTAMWATVLPGPASHRGGTLRIEEGPPFATIGGSLDPAVFTNAAQWQLLSMTNDGLVTYRRVGGLAGNTLVPDLATSLPQPTNGGRTYTFRLRAGVRYSTGVPVRPGDFRRAIERLFKFPNDFPKSPYLGIVGAQRCRSRPAHCTLGRGIVTDNRANTVTFHLHDADSYFLYKLAFPWAYAVPPGTPSHDAGTTPVPATGPYIAHVTSASGRTSWVLTRNPHFRAWSADAQPDGYPDRIVFRASQAPREAVKAVERGRIDVLLSPAGGSVGELATRYASLLHADPLASTFAFVMNTRVAPFDHLAVRRALGYAIDRRRVAALAGGPLAAHLTCQILPPTLVGYKPYCPYTVDPSASGTWTAPDLARAEQLVRKSGTRGMAVTVAVAPADAANPTDRIGPYLVSVLDRLGYRASLRVLSKYWLSEIADSRAPAQIAWFTWYQDYPTPSNFVDPLLTCDSFVPRSADNLNVAEFCSASLDRQIRRATSLETTEPGAAAQLWARIDRRLTDQAPWLPLYNPQVLIALSPRVGNYQYHPYWQVLLDQLWVR